MKLSIQFTNAWFLPVAPSIKSRLLGSWGGPTTVNPQKPRPFDQPEVPTSEEPGLKLPFPSISNIFQHHTLGSTSMCHFQQKCAICDLNIHLIPSQQTLSREKMCSPGMHLIWSSLRNKSCTGRWFFVTSYTIVWFSAWKGRKNEPNRTHDPYWPSILGYLLHPESYIACPN